MAIRILSSENVKGQLNVKDTQDTVFDSGLSVTRSLTTQTGYINIVGGAFNFNAPASISTKFRSNGNELIRIESDGDFWLRQVGKKLYFQNSAGSAPYIKNSGEDASTTPYGRNLEFYTDSYKRIEIDYAGTTTFDSGSNNVVAVFKSTDTETQVNFVDSTGFASIRSRNDFRFYVGGSSLIRAMDIADDGNVGIGVTGPIYKLVVAKDGGTIASFQDTTNSNGVQFTGYSGNIDIKGYADTADTWVDLGIRSTAGTQLYLKTDGNVGIGTDSPQTKLEVNGGLVKIVENSNTAFYGGDYVRVFGTQSYGFRNSAGSAIAQISLTGNSYFNGGNVGIGTTSPDSKLEVAGGSTGIRLSNVGDSGAYDSVEMTYNGYNSGTPEMKFRPTQTPGSGIVNSYFRFINSNGSSTTANNNANVTIDGNVGIGTNSPNAKLHIGPDSLVSGYTPDRSTLAISDITNGGQLIIRGQSPRIWFDGTAGGNAELFLDGSKLNILSGRPDALGSSRLYIKADGNVGIGTASPGAILDVSYGISASQTAIINLNGDNGAAAELVMRAGGDDGGTIYNRRAAIRYYSNQISTTTAQWVNGVSMTQATGDDNFYFNNSGNSTVLKLTQARDAVFGGNIYLPQSPGAVQGNGYPYTTYLGSGANATTTYIQAGSTFKTEIKLVGGDVGDFINFTAGNTERMRIQSDGNVGIGTTSPIAQLDVAGNTNQHHSVSTSNNGTWRSMINLGTVGWLDQTYSAGRVKIYGSENGNTNVSYCEYYVLRSSSGYHIQQIGTRLDVGNTHGQIEARISGNFLQVKNVANSSLGLVRAVLSAMKN